MSRACTCNCTLGQAGRGPGRRRGYPQRSQHAQQRAANWSFRIFQKQSRRSNRHACGPAIRAKAHGSLERVKADSVFILVLARQAARNECAHCVGGCAKPYARTVPPAMLRSMPIAASERSRRSQCRDKANAQQPRHLASASLRLLFGIRCSATVILLARVPESALSTAAKSPLPRARLNGTRRLALCCRN